MSREARTIDAFSIGRPARVRMIAINGRAGPARAAYDFVGTDAAGRFA